MDVLLSAGGDHERGVAVVVHEAADCTWRCGRDACPHDAGCALVVDLQDPHPGVGLADLLQDGDGTFTLLGSAEEQDVRSASGVVPVDLRVGCGSHVGDQWVDVLGPAIECGQRQPVDVDIAVTLLGGRGTDGTGREPLEPVTRVLLF